MKEAARHYRFGLPDQTFGEPHIREQDFLLLSQYTWIFPANEFYTQWNDIQSLYTSPCETVLLGPYDDNLVNPHGDDAPWHKKHISYAETLGIQTYSALHDQYAMLGSYPRVAHPTLPVFDSVDTGHEYDAVDLIFIDTLLAVTRLQQDGTKKHPIVFSLPPEISYHSIHANNELQRICSYLNVLQKGEAIPIVDDRRDFQGDYRASEFLTRHNLPDIYILWDVTTK